MPENDGKNAGSLNRQSPGRYVGDSILASFSFHESPPLKMIDTPSLFLPPRNVIVDASCRCTRTAPTPATFASYFSYAFGRQTCAKSQLYIVDQISTENESMSNQLLKTYHNTPILSLSPSQCQRYTPLKKYRRYNAIQIPV